jgi:hypothetical protein
MAGPYFNSPGWAGAPIGGTGCLGGEAGYINDDAAAACWAVHAAPVIINNTWMSVHAGFSFVNMLYRSYGEQPAVATRVGLPGPYIASA